MYLSNRNKNSPLARRRQPKFSDEIVWLVIDNENSVYWKNISWRSGNSMFQASPSESFSNRLGNKTDNIRLKNVDLKQYVGIGIF